MFDDVCKDCTERHQACWGSCSRYLEAKAKHDRVRQAAAKDRERNSALNHVQYHGLHKYKKEKKL